jgi:hypothetical protein
MVDSTQEKISFNITSRLNELREKEKSELANLRDINKCRVYVADKINIMNSLRIYEDQLEKYGDSVFQKEEIEAINKIEEFQRNLYSKKRVLLPLSMFTVLGFMQFYRQSLSVKTFYENIQLIIPVFAATYFVGNTFMDLGFRNRVKNFEKNIAETLIKARLHSHCMMLSNQLKYDPDRHLE